MGLFGAENDGKSGRQLGFERITAASEHRQRQMAMPTPQARQSSASEGSLLEVILGQKRGHAVIVP